jgi:ATP-dependent Clp protease ATP-binding subunit ClpA
MADPLVPLSLGDLIDAVDGAAAGDAPLERLQTAVLVGNELTEHADHLIGHFVDQARRAGASWTEIGARMGVSKQAAQQRFVPEVDLDEPGGGRLFRRFTPRARSAVAAAREEAAARGDAEVTTLHLVLGVLTEQDGLAGRALAEQGVTLESARAAAPAGDGAAAPTSPRFGTEAKRALALALRGALLRGHNYIGTEHILDGIVDGPDTAGAALLASLNVDVEALSAYVDATLAEVVKPRRRRRGSR